MLDQFAGSSLVASLFMCHPTEPACQLYFASGAIIFHVTKKISNNLNCVKFYIQHFVSVEV